MFEERDLTFRAIFLFTAVLCLFFVQLAVFAAEKVEQSNLPEWDGGWTHINPDPNGMARMWQTFTPEYSNITAVEIDILTVNTGDFDDIITVEIAKDGEILASTERNVEYGYEGLLRFDFAEAVAVMPGELYELRVRDTSLTRFGWKYASNTYDAGSRYVSATERSGTDWFFQTYSMEPRIIYVDDDATGDNDGSSWENAFTFLQDALTTTRLPDVEKPLEILVAQGTYKPNEGLLPIVPPRPPMGGVPQPGVWPAEQDEQATFSLINGVVIKGGYAGLGEPDPNMRDIELYQTVLSGDLNGNDIEVDDPCNLFDEPTRSDNSRNVISSVNNDASAIIDGFTITGGNIWFITFDGSGPPIGGAGMLISSGSPTLIDCKFTRNVTGNYGGGLLIYGDGNPTLINCVFTENYADRGAGIYNGASSRVKRDFSSPKFINCTFDNNYAGWSGGGIYNEEGNMNLFKCTFSRNFGSGFIGGGNSEFEDCIFIQNTGVEGGGISCWGSSTFANCIFNNNSAKYYGGGMECSNGLLTDCIFSGNSAGHSAGGLAGSDMVLNNCIFTGNKVYGDKPYQDYGGGCVLFGDNIMMTHCTFYGNWARQERAIFKYSDSVLMINNCILWDGGDEISRSHPSTLTVTYSNIQGGMEGEGNIDTDPLFANPGYWADVDDPNIAVEPSDPNAVWIEGDYHLKSQAGRWDPVSESWVQDDVTSPCIDAGDPNMPVGDEPDPNGDRINMGAYGGTEEASKSFTSELFQTTQELIGVYEFKSGK